MSGARGASGPDPRSPFAGDGEMAQRMRAFDWSRSELGPVAGWPNSLRTMVSVVLASRFPMLLWWGPRLIQLYNDGYRPILGDKHPASLAAPGARVWAEIWPVIGPMAEGVLAGGAATWSENLLLMLQRKGFLEETYFSFSYSGVPDDEGRPGGVLVTVQETTEQVQDERQLRMLRDLAALAADAKSLEGAMSEAVAALEPYAADVPCAVLYRLEDDADEAVLVATTGFAHGAREVLRERVALAAGEEGGAGGELAKRLAAAVATGQQTVAPSLADLLGPAVATLRPRLAGGGWAAPAAGIVQPLSRAGASRPYGFLVAGLSPHRALDERYRGLFRLAADQVAAAIANARAYEAERQRAEALAEIDRAKTAFFSNVSHEFRTPLTLMLGPLADLLARPEGEVPADQAELLRTVQRSALRLLRLVNTLLDFSRLEAGRARAAYEPVDLAAFTAELASMFRAAVDRAGLRLVVDCPPLPEPVWVDREMWEKIVSNLLSNAFKFTLEGEIAVSVRAAEGAAVLTVRDTGEGIPETELPRVFQRFHRVEGARGRTHEGTGIGLALVQDLARLHGGDVTVASTLGQGSTFTVTVPLGKAHLPAEHLGPPAGLVPTPVGAEAFVAEALRWLPGAPRTESGVEEVLPAGAPAAGAAPAATVLVADDNADMRSYLERLLAPRYAVRAAADGEEALRLATRHPVDLVLADVMMPRRDGFGLLAALRADPRTAALPVILVSARAGEEAVSEGMASGADDYLVKPFSARELLARVQGALAVSAVRREAASALRESEERFRHMADDAPMMVWVTDAGGACIFLSRSWYQFTGQTPETGLGHGWFEAVHAEDRARTRAQWDAAVAALEPVRLEYRLRRADGESRWVLDAAQPRRGPDGEPLGYIGSVIDISERKAAEQALEEADRRKDEFLSVLAHELRNPLAPIRSGVELLRRAGDAPATRTRTLDSMERQVAHLVRLVDDLLEVSRIKLGKVALRRQPTDLAVAAAAALETHQAAFEAARLRVEQDLPPGLLVDGDAVRLTQVVSNLLHNALKFTPPGGSVGVRARRDGAEAELVVADSGIGMSPAELDRAFELFAQSGQPGGEGTGLGIGLTLARRLAELHGGSLVATSEGAGRGSQFVLRLPLALTASPAEEPERRAGSSELARDGERRRRVLVVDDNVDAADSLAELLGLIGAEAEAVHDGDAALAAAREPREAIFLDLSMPGRDGFAVARALRERGERAWLVALTGYGQEEDRRRTAEAGFDDHLVKPVDVAALVRTLERAREAAGIRRPPVTDAQ